MASGNEPGQIKIVAEKAGSGKTRILWSGRSDGAVNAGHSPDGVLANLTADKQLFIPYSGPQLTGGDIIRVYTKLDASDGLDASDAVWVIPITEDGVRKELNTSDFGYTTDFPASTPADQWLELGTGYTIPSSIQSARFGNGQIVLNVEDDTA